MEQNNQMVIH